MTTQQVAFTLLYYNLQFTIQLNIFCPSVMSGPHSVIGWISEQEVSHQATNRTDGTNTCGDVPKLESTVA